MPPRCGSSRNNSASTQASIDARSAYAGSAWLGIALTVLLGLPVLGFFCFAAFEQRQCDGGGNVPGPRHGNARNYMMATTWVQMIKAVLLALDETGIAEIVECFAQAAARAERCGFDLIELHGVHGYLMPERVGLPTMATGMILKPQQANGIGADGQADMVGIGRAFLNDPRWGWHAAIALGTVPDIPRPYQRVSPKLWPGYRHVRGEEAAAALEFGLEVRS